MINEIRLCERMNISPDELENTPFNKVQDWLTVLRYEGELAEQRLRK